MRPEDDGVPDHDVVVGRRARNSGRWVLLKSAREGEDEEKEMRYYANKTNG